MLSLFNLRHHNVSYHSPIFTPIASLPHTHCEELCPCDHYVSLYQSVSSHCLSVTCSTVYNFVCAVRLSQDITLPISTRRVSPTHAQLLITAPFSTQVSGYSGCHGCRTRLVLVHVELPAAAEPLLPLWQRQSGKPRPYCNTRLYLSQEYIGRRKR